MPELFPGGREVSRETTSKLEAYVELVRHWSRRINLVSPADLTCLWQRHVVDSAQLVELTSTPQRWIDLGSGGGFPGIVVAILLARQPKTRVTLVESDKRKCAFLLTAARELGLNVQILPHRLEVLRPVKSTTLSARGLAPLDQLISHAQKYLSTDGTALFPKGRTWQNELNSVRSKWSFDCDVLPSVTDSAAAILKIQNIKRP